MSNQSEQRRAARIPCAMPVALLVAGAWRPATLLDVSRTGVRLRVSRPEATEDLPCRIAAQFHPDRLGDLIRRELSVLRVGVPEHGTSDVEIACELDAPLGDIEVAALALAIPPVG